MITPDRSRFVRIDRYSFGRLVGYLLSIGIGGAIAVGACVLGVDLYREEPTRLTAIALLITIAPLVLWGLYLASGSLLRLARKIGRRRTLIDLDAPEIVILRERPPRVLPSLGIVWFTLFLTMATLSNFRDKPPEIGAAIGTVLLLVIFLHVPILNLWTMWRLKASAFAPIVLDTDGFLDRSIRDMPRIAWPDIAAIDLQTGVVTLTGAVEAWAAERAPDRRWFARWRKKRIPRLAIPHYGLRPDAEYAVSLIHHYWQRRLSGHAVDRIGITDMTVQRA